jgi:hypothetical protein
MKNFLFILFFVIQSIFAGYSNTYISKENFQKIAKYVHDNSNYYENIKDGDIIFVLPRHLNTFFRNVYPKINHRFILITHGNDMGIPGSYKIFLKENKIIAWFGQNVNYSDDKLKPLPIGIGYSFYNSDIKIIDKVKKQSFEKKHLLYMNFNKLTHKERLHVYNLFHNKAYCYTPQRVDFENYLKDLASAKFVLSPRGGGVDCFRTWEALYMGAIPIVKTSALDPLFKNLPVLIIKNWESITEEFLLEKYEEMKKKQYKLEKLNINYWYELIHSYQ